MPANETGPASTMSLDDGAFEFLVPSRFITFTFPNPSLSLSSSTTTHYSLYTPLIRVAVLDSPTTTTTTNLPRIAAMLVPNHRETDWTFSTFTGHLHLLLTSPNISRLILLGNHLPTNPPHPQPFTRPPTLTDPRHQSQIEQTLTPLLFALSPKSSFKNGFPEIPFLDYEDDVIRSVVVETNVGSCVGEMLIEDVELEGFEFRRRLRFKRMPILIQTQIRLVPNNRGLGDLGFCLDRESLVHPYLTPMVAGLSLIGFYLEKIIGDGFRPKALCLGVGGGALLTFLNTQLGFEVLGVEADAVVLSVAKKFFGLEESEHMSVCIGDGIELLSGQARKPNCLDSKKFDVIMVDLDTRDAAMGVMAPPLEFVGKSVLVDARSVLNEHGILVINVIPPSRSFYEVLIQVFREVFEELYEIDVENGENFVLIAAVSQLGTVSTDSENSFVSKLKLVISGAYLDSIRKI